MNQDLGAKSRFSRFADALSIVFGFVLVNLIIGAVVWRIFVGPIKQIHEW